jgi:hypothetical protein
MAAPGGGAGCLGDTTGRCATGGELGCDTGFENNQLNMDTFNPSGG